MRASQTPGDVEVTRRGTNSLERSAPPGAAMKCWRRSRLTGTKSACYSRISSFRPGKTGLELAVSCLSMKSTLRVLLMSAWAGTEFLDCVGIPKGAPFFLPKPFRSSTLVNRVRRVLESPAPIVWLEKGSKVRIEGFSSA
jgi:hypothetical protein